MQFKENCMYSVYTCGKMDESAGVLGMEKHLYSKEQIIYGNWVDYTFGKYPLLSFFFRAGGIHFIHFRILPLNR